MCKALFFSSFRRAACLPLGRCLLSWIGCFCGVGRKDGCGGLPCWCFLVVLARFEMSLHLDF